MAYKILIGDDDPETQKNVSQLLEKENYRVCLASDGQQVLDAWIKEYYDCLVFDVMMPVINGLDLCQRIRRLSNVPIILLTALGEEEDVIKGLDCGADDYIQKPFRQKEFLARLRVVIKRNERMLSNEKSSISYGSMTLEPQTRQVKKKGKLIETSPLEYQLLFYLMHHPGEISSKEELLCSVWGYSPNHKYHSEDLNMIEAAIRRLRKKVEDNPSKPRLIHTVWGSGYRFGN